MGWRLRRASQGVSALLAVTMTAWTLPAAAIDKETCVNAAEAGQRLRNEHKLVASREQLLVCASTECPGIVSQDCTSWLGQVERSLASIVVTARDGRGQPVVDARVVVDGAALVVRTPTAPIELDPGPHVVRCERAGFAPAEQRVSLDEGERGHAVVCEMPSPVTAAPAPSATSLPTTPGAREGPGSAGTAFTAGPPSGAEVGRPPRGGGGIPWPSWVLGGVGIAALGSFAFFGLSGQSDQNQAEAPGGCAPNCHASQVDPIRTKFAIADVSLGVGIVALAAAAIVAVVHSSSEQGASR